MNTNLTMPCVVLAVEGPVPLEMDAPALESRALKPPVNVSGLQSRGLECAHAGDGSHHPPLRGLWFETLCPGHRLVTAHFLGKILLRDASAGLGLSLHYLLKVHNQRFDHKSLETAVTETVLVVGSEEVGGPDDGQVAGGHPGDSVLGGEVVQVPHQVGEGAQVRPGQSRHQLPQTRHLVAQGKLGSLDEVLVEAER